MEEDRRQHQQVDVAMQPDVGVIRDGSLVVEVDEERSLAKGIAHLVLNAPARRLLARWRNGHRPPAR